MELKPDFNRLLAAGRRKKTHPVAPGEILIDYSIQSKFLGRTVELA
jgi:hypothetical protein